MAEWAEEEHPRSEGGKFSIKEGAVAVRAKEATREKEVLSKLSQAKRKRIVLRPEGFDATSDEAYKMLDNIKREGHVYRGMTDYEYQATIGANRPIRSTGKYSFESEGTNFASNPSEAESYANFGRDDPRKTGKSTWLVEVKLGADIVLGKDGYYKTADEIGLDRVSRVWKMSAEGGAVMMEQIK